MQELLCPWESTQYFVYSSNIPTLFFYSHIPAILVALLVGLLVFLKSGKSKIGISLLTVSILFSAWSLFDLVLWSTNRPAIVIFFWSLQILFEPLVYLMCFYLVYLFIRNEDLAFKWKLLGILLYSPIVILLSSKFNLQGVNLVDCTAIESFTENWTLAQAGLIGMPIFIGFLAYLIVRFHTFNIKIFATQALMASIWFLVLGILFIRQIENVRVITGITLILVTIAGDLLVKSVKREIEQKEELAKLNVELKDLLAQRESLMHLINHKVKGSFTRSKYIFAGMLDGTFGDINEEIKKRANQGLESDDAGIKTIDLVLNTDNLQKGLIKYDMKTVDLKDIALKIISEKKGPAETKGIGMKNDIKEGTYSVLGDSFWLKEAINNLLENSIRYTKSGTITLGLEKNNDKILLSVKDTGIGMTPEDRNILFTQGGRGKDSVKTNVDSTGYGLYSVKLIIDAHKGRVYAESPGVDKGSTFFIEFPVV